MGARRERRRTMIGDSYFTSVSTGGIGMTPGHPRAAPFLTRRALVYQVPTVSRVSQDSTSRPAASLVVNFLQVRRRPTHRREGGPMGFCAELLLLCVFNLLPRWPFRWPTGRGERVTARRAALIRVFAPQGADYAPRASSSSVRRARAVGQVRARTSRVKRTRRRSFVAGRRWRTYSTTRTWCWTARYETTPLNDAIKVTRRARCTHDDRTRGCRSLPDGIRLDPRPGPSPPVSHCERASLILEKSVD